MCYIGFRVGFRIFGGFWVEGFRLEELEVARGLQVQEF